MKNIFILLVSALTLLSCSSESSESSSSSDVLQKVVFYHGTADENQWNFNLNGLLDNIAKPDGTLIEKFVYDTNGNVIQDTKYVDGAPTEIYLVTYSSSNIITSINEVEYNYDYSSHRYSYTNGTENFECNLNDDLLLIGYTHSDSNPVHTYEINYEMAYTNGNLMSFQRTSNGNVDAVRNFGYPTTAVTANGNPLRNATLAIQRLKSLIDPDFFINGILSHAVLESLNFGPDSPMHYNYGLLTDDNSYLGQQDIEVYNGDTFVEFIQYMQFLYI